MEATRHALEDSLSNMVNGRHASELSRATSPGGERIRWNVDAVDESYKRTRYYPRTYPYFKCLPYEVEEETRRQGDLEEILKHLYIAVQAGDFSPGAVHWTRELRSWLSLKFDLTKEQRVKLVKLYYELSLAPGIETSTSERFSSMFMLLVK